MIKRNRLILIEPEMTEPKGHFLNNLIDISKFFQNKFNIYWILNNKFESRGTHIPKQKKIIYSFSSNNFKRKKNKFLYVFEELYLFFKNIFYTIFFLFFFIIDKKFLLYLNALRSNYFILPKYFNSFYFTYNSLNLNKNDHIFFPTGRRKDLALINFLSKIDLNHPKFHLRIFLPQKKKFKGFFYYLKEIDLKLKNKRIFIYVWKNNFKLFLKNSISKKGIYETNLIFSYNPKSYFSRKFKKKNHIIGYLGHARREKGFHRLPKIIKTLEKNRIPFKYIIQFSKISDDLIFIRDTLYKLSYKNKNIQIIDKYVSHNDFIKYLKKIDIMPILHNVSELNNITSGTAYSCVPYQIPLILPYGVHFISNINKFKSYEKAKNVNDIVEKINVISKNYKFYLNNAKLNSQNLKKIINIDPVIKNIS